MYEEHSHPAKPLKNKAIFASAANARNIPKKKYNASIKEKRPAPWRRPANTHLFVRDFL